MLRSVRMERISREITFRIAQLISTLLLGIWWLKGRTSPFVRSEKGEETGLKLWNEMMEILSKVAPEVQKLF
jgi:hypothetical protein